VLPSGFDPDRFPWTTYRDLPESNHRPLTLFFAGLTQEVMKGFHVLREACRHLWSERQDFRLRITADAEPNADAFCEFVGWQSQADLPQQLRQADIVVCPTIAEEALGRTAVEAMGAWRPVVASRIGGLPFTVLDEATGLLCRPGDPVDLARQLGRLLDDATLRERFGTAGRRRFDEVYAWPVILERGYRPLLGPAVCAAGVSSGKEGRR
jgi:glycosyltransferase involved in cell wall biosynthesis